MKRFLPCFLRLAPRSSLFVLLTLFPLLLVSPSAVHAQWEPDVRLTFDPDSSCLSSNGRCLAVSGDTVHVVWFDRRDGNWEIYYKRSLDAGTSWNQDTRLTADPASSQNPSIAVSGSTIHLVWQDSRDGNGEIYYKNSTDGGVVWSPDTQLTADSSASGSPCIAVSGAMVHVVWWDNRTGVQKIYYKRSSDGGLSWTPDIYLTSGLSGYHESPCISSSGNFISLAYQADGLHIAYKHSLDGGLSWSPDTVLARGWNNGFFGDSHTQPSVFGDEPYTYLGWLFYHWGRYNWQNVTKICYSISTDDGSSWIPYDSLTTIWGSYYTFSSPSIYASGSYVHTVWRTPPYSPNEEISYCFSRDRGASWQPEIRLTNDSARSIDPFVSAHDSKVHVIWVDNRDGNYEVYYKRNPTGNGVVFSEALMAKTPVPSLKANPNPFWSFTSVPGHASEHFVLYDISGRKVGTYKGDRIGSGLSAGIYFLKPEGKDTKHLRIVKLR